MRCVWKLVLLVASVFGCSLLWAQSAAPPVVPSAELILTNAPAPVAVAPTPTLAQIEWSGDVRYRLNKGHEDIDQDRTWHQLRVRLGMRAPVNDRVHAVVRLATATSSISANQTLGDANDPGMPRRSFGLDLGYMDWNIFDSTNVWVGRTANPFWSPNKTQLVFDSDLAFEGLALRFNPKWSTGSVFLNSGLFVISENYAAPEDVVDTGLLGAELGLNLHSDSSNWSLTTRGGTYQYINIQNRPITSVEKDATVDPYSYPYDRYRGNTVNVNDPLLPKDQRKYYFQNKYILFVLGAEWKHKVGPIEYMAFADGAINSAIGQQRSAYEYGLLLKWKFLTLSEAFVTKNGDSVMAAFTDSDTNGGGTDNKGTRTQLFVQLGANAQVVITQYLARRGVDTVARDYTLNQADLSVSF